MTSDILIRSVTSNEVDLLREIGETTFRETFEDQNSPENLSTYLSESFSLEAITAQFNNPSSSFYFAIKGNEILGYLKLNNTEDRVEIQRIYVKGIAQGQGIGKALFEFAKQVAHARQANWLWLGVWQENKKAIAFYKAYGLEIFEQRKFKLGEDIQDDYLMRLRMGSST